MNRKLHLLTLALLSGALGYTGSTRADDITIDPVPFVSSRSPAEVRAELDAFKKSGVNPWSLDYQPLQTFRSSRTRAEVTAEYIRDREAVAAMTREDSGSRYLAEQREAGSSAVHLATRRSKKMQK
jgi:hypothetical protein